MYIDDKHKIDAFHFLQTTIPIILGHSPAGSSIKQFFHYAQGHNASKSWLNERNIFISIEGNVPINNRFSHFPEKFRQFDYGSVEINNIFYNKTEPPEYKVENARIPITFYYAKNDLLADSKVSLSYLTKRH